MSWFTKPRMMPVLFAVTFAILVVLVLFTAAALETWWMAVTSILGRFDDLEVLAQVATLFVILGGLYVAWRRSEAHFLQAKTAEQGQITDRFTKAVEQLTDEGLAVRLGGIYALERIAADSHDRDHRVVFEVLCAFVREKRTPQEEGQDLGELPQDVQAVLSVIRRRERIPEGEVIDLHGADLRKADLHGAYLVGANLFGTHLERANLREAHLRRAYLEGTYLEEADLRKVHLEEANLILASLEKAYLVKAHLQGAKLNEARLKGTILAEANLEGATLNRVDLEDAQMSKARLKGASLTLANLCGVDLREVVGLTMEQVDLAKGDTFTRLPSSCGRPERWGPEVSYPIMGPPAAKA